MPSIGARAAASSIASGRPSTERHTDTTDGHVGLVSGEAWVGRLRAVDEECHRAAGKGLLGAGAGRRQIQGRQPQHAFGRHPNRTWLVTTSFSPGAASSRRAASRTTPSRRCSALSSASSRSSGPTAKASASSGSPPPSRTPSA
jgi:hypothetical protein